MTRWLWVLAATIYVLPKEQPKFDGMIIRCENVEASTETVVTQSNCHWECDKGAKMDTKIEHGNRIQFQTGCNGQQAYTDDNNGEIHFLMPRPGISL